MKTKNILWIMSGIIGGLFIITVLILYFNNKIKIGGLVIFSVVIVLIVIAVNLIFMFRNKTIDVTKNGESKTTIKLEEARKMADGLMLNQQHSDYEKERLIEGVWSKGKANTPIYVRASIGVFESIFYAICINMENPTKYSVREYPKTFSQKELEYALDVDSNLISSDPKPIPRKEEELIEDPTGRRIIRTRDIANQEEQKPKDGGLE